MEDSVEFNKKAIGWLEKAELWIYMAIGGAFVLLLAVAFSFAWFDFFKMVLTSPMKAILTLVSETLLALIILEILGTVINYMKVHTIQIEPFFYIGIIASIRRILAAGTHHPIGAGIEDRLFSQYLFDLGINAGVIFFLSLALFLFAKKK